MTISFSISRHTANSTSRWLLAGLLLFSTGAWAADPFAKRVAKAQTCYERKLYDCAINELEAAYLIRPMPALLLNIAHAYLDYGRPRDAIVYYDRYMVEEKNLAPEAREDVEKFKRQAEQKLVAMQAANPANPGEKTTPSADNKTPLGGPSSTTPSDGSTATEGSSVTTPAVVVPPVDTTGPATAPSAAAKWLPVGAVALGGASLIAGIALGGAALSAAKNAVATDAPYNPDTDSRGKTLSNAGIALDVIGGVALVGGLIPILVSATKKPSVTYEKNTSEKTTKDTPPQPQVSVSFSSRSVVLSGRF